MNITHVFIFSAEHHALPYIDFIEEQLSKDEFTTNILVYSKAPSKKMTELTLPNLVLSQNRKDVLTCIKNASENNRVIIHGIYDNVIFFQLFFIITFLCLLSYLLILFKFFFFFFFLFFFLFFFIFLFI